MKKILPLLLVLMLMNLAPAWSQGCAMCTKTASELDAKAARGLNGGILYLAALPLLILGTVGFVWWRGNRGTSEQ